jgi:hypothetical protein
VATITVTLSDNQVVGAKDHFGTQDNTQALTLFREWVANHANQWYADYVQKDINAISAALAANPSQILSIMQTLGLVP